MFSTVHFFKRKLLTDSVGVLSLGLFLRLSVVCPHHLGLVVVLSVGFLFGSPSLFFSFYGGILDRFKNNTVSASIFPESIRLIIYGPPE